MKKALENHNTVKEKGEKKSDLKEALIASEIRYRRLFESAKDGILILDAETGMIVDVNPFLINLLGYSKSDFIEKAIWEIGFLNDIIENKEKFAELQQNKYVRYEDLPLKTSTGNKIHVEFVSNVYIENQKEVIQCNIRDITERINIQNEIKFQVDLINNVGQAIVATDLQGTVIYWNNAAEKIYGWLSSEAIGQNIIHLTPAQQTKEQAIDSMQKLSMGQTWAGEFLVKRKDGSSFPAFVTDTPMVSSDGELKGIIGISSDVTERKRNELELILAKEKAEESERLKSAFLANMSHEIRTPMNGILGFTELLKNIDLNGEQQQQYIGIIEKSGARLLNIINDIISISKIESKETRITVTETNVNELMAFIYHFFKPEAAKKNLKFSFKNGLSTKDAFVNTDREKIYAILTNLVKNAIKFTQSGYIETGYNVKNGFIEFYVSDSGTGIPLEQREYIFERFRQGNETLTSNYEGAGLGLSISKAYVEMLGGKIWIKNRTAESSLNGDREITGSVFYFTIPANFTQKIKPDIAVKVVDNEAKGNAKKLKILLVEDDFNSELLMRAYLKMFAKEILHVSNGIDAVNICKKNDDIDLILMDINMLGMNGYEATRNIRTFNNHVVIIAQTAYALSGDKEKVIAAGCNNYISKPISHHVLCKMINSYFN